MQTPQYILPLQHKLKVVIFAGGGGTCEGMEMATGTHVDIAINHDDDALSMHRVNHPQAKHYVADCYEVDPLEACEGRYVGDLHGSPDCTDHSQAKGGQPRRRQIRSLSWVMVRWAGVLRKRGLGPDVITLENVEQILQWSPLVAKRCKTTGRVIKLDGTVAEPGVRVPVENQFLVPDTKRKGRNWQHFVGALRAMGGKVEWKKLVAADYGTPTTRERLFMVCRFDGLPIEFPQATHFKRPKVGKLPAGKREWPGAHTCIDFDTPCPSIFDRKRPLAEATMRRIAKGLKKYVLDSADPFIVRTGQTGGNGDGLRSIHDPLSTVVSKAEHCLVTPTLIQAGYGERAGQAPRCLDIREPLGVVTAGGRKHALAAPVLIQAGHGEGKPGSPRWSHGCKDVREPVGTVTASGGGQALAAAFLAQMNGGNYQGCGRDARDPMSTVTTAGSQQQLVTCTLSPEYEAGALRVAAFLIRYYGEGGQWSDLRDPVPTITTRERLALVTVLIQGTPFVVVNIGLRMLKPRELFNANGFPPSYIIDKGHDGRTFTISKQVRFCGNSVPPLLQKAVTACNHSGQQAYRKAA